MPQPHDRRGTAQNPYRVVRQLLPLDYGGGPELPGIDGPDGAEPPKSSDEARAVGCQAARDGLELHEVIVDGMRRWPGNLYVLGASLAAAAIGWCSTRWGREVNP
jgi:hypothetical protein